MKPTSGLPVVTLLLIVANILAAYLLLVNPDLAFDFGFRPNQPKVLAAFTSLFLHANVLHLLANMIFLAAVGAAVELATGSLRFAVVFMVSGLVGVAAHFLMARNAADPAPLIGASGAIAGCASYYTIRYMGERITVAPRITMPVAAITGLWLAIQIIGAFVRIGEGAGVSYWSHLGGFAAGIALSILFRAPDPAQVRIGHQILDTMGSRSPAALATAAEHHLQRHPDDRKALHDLAQSYELLGDHGKEAGVLLRLIEVGGHDEQANAIRRLAQIGRITQLPILKRLQLADRHRADSEFVARALLKSVTDGPEDPQRPEAMLALAGLERETDPESAAALLNRLEAEYPLHTAVELARKRGWLT